MQQQKRIGVATTNIKLDFNTKATKEKQGHFIMVKGQEGITILCLCLLKTEPQKQNVAELFGEIDNSVITVGFDQL